jgi:hypothetical protein
LHDDGFAQNLVAIGVKTGLYLSQFGRRFLGGGTAQVAPVVHGMPLLMWLAVDWLVCLLVQGYGAAKGPGLNSQGL